MALYHGLAYARTLATPDTVVLCTPAEPYVCLGYHQDLEREIEPRLLPGAGLPVLRRETGGGAVYLDSSQLLRAMGVRGERLPLAVGRRSSCSAVRWSRATASSASRRSSGRRTTCTRAARRSRAPGPRRSARRKC
jgi:hypothetical protein